MKSSFIALLICTLFSATSLAEPTAILNKLEKDKAKIVSRLYQSTYGRKEGCKKAIPDVAAEFESELTHFEETNGNLIKLVIHSPYYDRARQIFSKHEILDPVRDTPESLGRECKFLAQVLRTLSDTLEGKKAVKEYEEILTK